MQSVPKPVNGNRLLMAMACVAILTAFVAISCKKKTEESVADRMQKSWSVAQIIDSFYSSSSLAPMVSTYEGKTGEYMHFKPDGKLYSFVNKAYDTAQYTYSEQNFKINVRGHKYNILTLTNTSMVLYEPKYMTTAGTNDYSAYKITLKR